MAIFENDTLIDRYLNDEMTGAELQDFTKKMETDPSLKAEVDLMSKLVNGIRQDAELRNRLKEIDQNTTAERKEKGSGRRLFIQIAAAACIVLIGLVAFFAWPSQLSTDELYAANYSPIEVEYDKGQDIAGALKSYANGDYAAALPLLEKSDNIRHLRYVAICHMELNQHEKAIPFLDRAIAKDFENRPQALWYKALCLLKLKRMEAAKATLELISKEAAASGRLKKDASRLLNKL